MAQPETLFSSLSVGSCSHASMYNFTAYKFSKTICYLVFMCVNIIKVLPYCLWLLFLSVLLKHYVFKAFLC